MQFNIDTKNGRAALDAIFKAVFGQKVPVVPLPADNPRNSSAFAYTCAVPDEKSNYFSFLVSFSFIFEIFFLPNRLFVFKGIAHKQYKNSATGTTHAPSNKLTSCLSC
jgi:hypothetical protein